MGRSITNRGLSRCRRGRPLRRPVCPSRGASPAGGHGGPPLHHHPDKFQFAVRIPAHSRCVGCATGDSFSASGQTRFRLRRPLGSALHSGAISLLRSPARYNSRCGTLAAGSLSPATAPTNIRGCAPAWFVGIRSGLSSPAHGLRAMRFTLRLFATRGFAATRGTNSRAVPVLVCAPRSAPSALLTTPPRYRQTPI